MKKYICLRDDDTNYYTSVEDINNAYGDILGSIPITLATIPMVHGSEQTILLFNREREKFRRLRNWEIEASPDVLTEYHKIHPIGDNDELISFLKPLIAEGKIEIAQHGVYHRYTERGPEMFRGRISFEAIRDGKEYLERIFNCEVRTFVPPSNSIDPWCVECLSKLNMHLFSSGSIKYNNIGHMMVSYFKDPLSVIDKIKHGRFFKSPIYRRCGIDMFGGLTVNSNEDEKEIIKRIEYELNANGFVAIGTHYRAFANNEYKVKYYNILSNYLKDATVEFVTADNYYKIARKVMKG